MRKFRNLSFGLQIILMLLTVVLSISVMVRAFVSAKVRSDEARILSDAITLASNGAEVFRSSLDENEIYRALNENNNAILADEIIVLYNEDLEPDQNGNLVMAIALNEEKDFTKAEIKVYYYDKEVYSLSTGMKGGRP